MTYLSRIRVNPLRAETRRLLASPHMMHGAVMGGVPTVRGAERVLWRLDADDVQRPHLAVLTESRPDWSHIVERAGWPDAGGEHVLVRDYGPLLAAVKEGHEFAFRLTANPVQNTASPLKPTPNQSRVLAAREEPEAGRRPRGFRTGHVTAAQQMGWFLRRAQTWGFEVPLSRTDPCAPGLAETPSTADAGQDGPREVRITARRRWSFRKGSKGPEVTFRAATFEGLLRVTDPTVFTARLTSGFGPSKAYGCGLLTLAATRE